ncbi:MAG: hypothetical protein CMF89_00030 [Candidatus Marinimicrobia bacterium]|nr:hypothetical protein [Candidatus Neomarinimicrobiota bacterium]
MDNKINFYNHYSYEKYSIQSLICSSFRRSFGKSQINNFKNIKKKQSGVHIFLESFSKNANIDFQELIKLRGNKIILNGKLNDQIKEMLSIKILNSNFDYEKPIPANSLKPSISSSKITFNQNLNYLKPFLKEIKERPLWRYDFDVEWNNNFCGNISNENKILNLSHNCLLIKGKNVAFIKNSKNQYIPLISEFEINGNIIIWINRNLSLVDLPEWKIIEEFISNGYFKKYPCIPYLSEYSSSENGLITMRLDCDEDIESARKIFEIYKYHNLPISLAITTNQIKENQFISSLPKEVNDYGGTILNHSHSHPINWGGSKDKIKEEIITSNNLIKKSFGITTEYAVSPFHHLTWEALEVLSELDFKGVIAGISSSHHEFLIIKGGLINEKLDILMHSQQCMIHGDCLTKTRKIDSYLNTFSLYSNLGFSTGYLDHPISERYDYGWINFERQVKTHQQIIEYLLNKKIKFIGQKELFQRFAAKEKIKIKIINQNDFYSLEIKNENNICLSIKFGGKRFNCEPLTTTYKKINKKD